MINESTIKEFQDVVKSEYGVWLNDNEARSILQNWVGYFDLLAKIDYREKAETRS